MTTSRFLGLIHALFRPERASSSCYPRLPPELYRLIIQEIQDPQRLHTLLFVSSAFRYEAERVLYRFISLSNTPKVSSIYIRLRLFRHLSNCTRVASLVRSLDIAVAVTYSSYYNIPAEVTKLYCESIHKALCAMPNLKALSLNMHPHFQTGCMISTPSCLLSGCTFQLQSLILFHLRASDVPSIETQRDIQELDVGPVELVAFSVPVGWPTFSQDAFPNLTILACNSYYARQLLVCRSVKALDWRGFDMPLDGLPILPSVTSLRGCPSDREDSSLIFHVFPSLRYLCLVSWNNDGILLKITQALGQATSLERLSFVYYGATESVFPPPLEITALCRTAKHLKTIIFDYGYLSPCLKWVRGTETWIECNRDQHEREWKHPRWF